MKAKKEKLFGFGHRVYRNFDPRANIIKEVGWLQNSYIPELPAWTVHLHQRTHPRPPPSYLVSHVQVAEEVFTITGRDPLIEIAKALQDAALSDDYFVQVNSMCKIIPVIAITGICVARVRYTYVFPHSQRKLYPNVDFYSGLVYRAMGFPPQFFTVLFALPR